MSLCVNCPFSLNNLRKGTKIRPWYLPLQSKLVWFEGISPEGFSPPIVLVPLLVSSPRVYCLCVQNLCDKMKYKPTMEQTGQCPITSSLCARLLQFQHTSVPLCEHCRELVPPLNPDRWKIPRQNYRRDTEKITILKPILSLTAAIVAGTDFLRFY